MGPPAPERRCLALIFQWLERLTQVFPNPGKKQQSAAQRLPMLGIHDARGVKLNFREFGLVHIGCAGIMGRSKNE